VPGSIDGLLERSDLCLVRERGRVSTMPGSIKVLQEWSDFKPLASLIKVLHVRVARF
jgi:hypothetical protein